MASRASSLVVVALLAAAARAEELPWKTDLAEALAKAKETGRPVLVGLYIPSVETDLERQDEDLASEAVRARLSGVVLAKASLFAHAEWRRSEAWTMPHYLFLDADGSVIHEHLEWISVEAFDACDANRRQRVSLDAAAAAPGAGADAWLALARWHAERLNRPLAVQAFKRAVDATPGAAAALPLLLEMTNACSSRFAPGRDEASARWALSRMKELDPKDEQHFAGKRTVRGIELTLEAGRLEEGAAEASAYLAENPRSDVAGDVLVRRVWALSRLCDFAEAAKALAGRKAYAISAELEPRLARDQQRFVQLAALRAAADRDPPSYAACIAYLQRVHDDPPKGFWIRYLRRAVTASDAPADQAPGLKLELARALAGTDDAGIAEARTIVDDLLAHHASLPAELLEQAARLKKRLAPPAQTK